MSFDRYAQVRKGSSIGILPFGEIPKKNTDRYMTYRKGETRLDIVSYEFYGDANFAWLILQANPQYGSLEFNIPDGVELRIPFPLDQSLEEYRSAIAKQQKLYD